MGTFFVGVDLGQAADYSALIVCEKIDPGSYDERDVHLIVEKRVRRPAWIGMGGIELAPALHGEAVRPMLLRDGEYVDIPEPGKPSYDVRHIVRWPLNTSYPTIVSDVATLMATPQLRGSVFVADATGVGRPVIDMFREIPGDLFHLVPVMIHGGDAVTMDDVGYTHAPKRQLVSTVAVALQSKRQRFARGLPLVDTLTKELLSFQVKINLTTAHDSYGAWREGAHDDLVLSLALALWHAERATEVTVRWIR